MGQGFKSPSYLNGTVAQLGRATDNHVGSTPTPNDNGMAELVNAKHCGCFGKKEVHRFLKNGVQNVKPVLLAGSLNGIILLRRYHINF